MRFYFVLFSIFMITPAVQGGSIDQASPEQGKALFETHCAACHGLDGRGKIPGISDLNQDIGKLAQDWQQTFERVRDGFQDPGSIMAMPARGGADLSDSELWDALAYINAAFGKR